MKKAYFFLFLTFVLFSAPKLSFAHREDYIDETLVFMTISPQELELEYWADFGHRIDPKQNFFRHSFAVEYGINERWMVDTRVTLDKTVAENLRWDSGRLETRYRFAEEGTHLVDVAISGELNAFRKEDGTSEYAIEPRLILSKDFGRLNLTANLPVEVPIESGELELIPALGFRYDTEGVIRWGNEVKYNLNHQVGSVVPQLWLDLWEEATIKLGYSHGFGRDRESFARIAVEAEF